MRDKEFVNVLKQTRIELHKRIGKKMCKELHAGCFDCQTRWLIGLINEWIDLLDFKKNTKTIKKQSQ